LKHDDHEARVQAKKCMLLCVGTLSIKTN